MCCTTLEISCRSSLSFSVRVTAASPAGVPSGCQALLLKMAIECHRNSWLMLMDPQNGDGIHSFFYVYQRIPWWKQFQFDMENPHGEIPVFWWTSPGWSRVLIPVPLRKLERNLKWHHWLAAHVGECIYIYIISIYIYMIILYPYIYIYISMNYPILRSSNIHKCIFVPCLSASRSLPDRG